MLLLLASLDPDYGMFPRDLVSSTPLLHYNFFLSALTDFTDISLGSKSQNYLFFSFIFSPLWIPFPLIHFHSLLMPNVWHPTFLFLERGEYSPSSILRSALRVCDSYSHPASSQCSTHSSYLCSSSYLNHHFSCNLLPTFACLFQPSLLLQIPLANLLSFC